MKKLLAVLVVLLVAGALFAAAGSDRGGAAAASSGPAMIGLAMPETHVLRWIKDGNSLKAEAEKRGYRAEVQWADGNQAIQNQHIQSFLTQGAKALVIGNINDGVDLGGRRIIKKKKVNVA
jgi:putative multiple sugar transport system substrate-binding protein